MGLWFFSESHRGIRATACAVLAAGYVAGPASADILPVAVVEFTSSCRATYQSSLPEIIVDELVNSGKFDVLERAKLEAVINELGFQAGSGFVSPDSAVQMGNMLGARLLISGHVLDHGQSKQNYSGYGVSTTKTTYRLKARMEVIDVGTGAKIFSRVAEASDEQQVVQGQNFDNTQRSLATSVGKQLVRSLLSSERIASMTDQPEEQIVAVQISSQPPDADVEVDGTYYGTAGQPVSLTPGTHMITVSLPGYLSWEKRVMVQEGTRIVARLQPDNTQRSESKVTIGVKSEQVN